MQWSPDQLLPVYAKNHMIRSWAFGPEFSLTGTVTDLTLTDAFRLKFNAGTVNKDGTTLLDRDSGS